jgi:L,D-transpeptidase ErfK/SrfK
MFAAVAVHALEENLIEPEEPPREFEENYSEEDFYRKAGVTVPFEVVLDANPWTARSVLGNRRLYDVRKGDTFLDLARFYGLGYNEIIAANPGVDPWIPEAGRAITLPTEWVLPQVEGRGVIVNIPEMRLYYYHPREKDQPLRVTTYPVGLGRDDWRTPKGSFRISGKTENPVWVIPESIRKERLREDGIDEKMIPGGHPRNPLGKFRLELTLPGYRIHGTNKSYGVGMQVSHGCVRLYPEDIESLYAKVPVGAAGEFIYQPVKVGARGGKIYLEVHQDIYTQLPGLYSEATRLIEAAGWTDLVDMGRVESAVGAQSGLPFEVSRRTRWTAPDSKALESSDTL